jgi:hypothetical protein
MIVAGGLCFIVGALAFVGVFSWLAAKFDYPKVLDGEAHEVLPRLRGGGDTMRAVWALYAFLPLLLVPGALATGYAWTKSPEIMTLALVSACIGALAMCLGLMRWPSIHWELARAWETAGEPARHALAATFRGLNLYLGNYIGEFLGELCLGLFFILSAIGGLSYLPTWLDLAGIAFGALFIIGAFRNVTPKVQWIADVNNFLLPLWMVVLGLALTWDTLFVV